LLSTPWVSVSSESPTSPSAICARAKPEDRVSVGLVLRVRGARRGQRRFRDARSFLRQRGRIQRLLEQRHRLGCCRVTSAVSSTDHKGIKFFAELSSGEDLRAMNSPDFLFLLFKTR